MQHMAVLLFLFLPTCYKSIPTTMLPDTDMCCLNWCKKKTSLNWYENENELLVLMYLN